MPKGRARRGGLPPKQLDALGVNKLRARPPQTSVAAVLRIRARWPGGGLPGAADVHYGRASAIRDKRAAVLMAAYASHPERFVRKAPEPPALPTVAWINRLEEVATTRD